MKKGIFITEQAGKSVPLERLYGRSIRAGILNITPDLADHSSWRFINNMIAKQIKGEKYIYLLMAYTLAKANEGRVVVGEDSGFVGGYNFMRAFAISEYDGRTILHETKSSKNFADFTRYFEVYGDLRIPPKFREYINESEENCSTRWVHYAYGKDIHATYQSCHG